MRQVIAVLLLVMFAIRCAVAAEPIAVSVPIRLDYQLLQQLLSRQLFTGPDHSRVLLNEPGNCSQIVLTDPTLAPQAADLEIQASVNAQFGLELFGMCFNAIKWHGVVSFLGAPVIKPGGTAMGLKPQGIWLTRPDGDKITSGRLWDYLQQPLRDLFSSFSIDLSPFTTSLGSLLPELLPDRSQAQMQATLDSLKLGPIKVGSDALVSALEFTVEPKSAPAAALPVDALTAKVPMAEAPTTEAPVAGASPIEPALRPEELQQWQERWQTMDALLVFAVKHYASATGHAALRSTLLDILIDSRYQLVAALAEPQDPANDRVRSWFVQSWQALSPVVRSIALEQEGDESLMWMSVLAATDALYALDQLGPQAGFDISTDGLRRLARMINQGLEPEELRYDEAIDPQLQQLFQQQLEQRAASPAAWRISFSLISPVYAQNAVGNIAETAAAQDERLAKWVPQPGEIDAYMPLVADVLESSTQAMLAKYKLDKPYQGLFKKLVLATAWQESCWRQFIVRDDKIVPLTSSTGDVGLMQMNERIWRGFYDLQKLRWDIRYNSNAGAEVLLDYLVKYAINRKEHSHAGGVDNLARASYSAYNGGPGMSSRYRQTDVSAYEQKVDRAFWKKFLKINEGDRSGIARCLGAVS